MLIMMRARKMLPPCHAAADAADKMPRCYAMPPLIRHAAMPAAAICGKRQHARHTTILPPCALEMPLTPTRVIMTSITRRVSDAMPRCCRARCCAHDAHARANIINTDAVDAPTARCYAL